MTSFGYGVFTNKDLLKYSSSLAVIVVIVSDIKKNRGAALMKVLS